MRYRTIAESVCSYGEQNRSRDYFVYKEEAARKMA
jgi:hypothetical protein